MPPEPKKPIEELLEASAQSRRAEFGSDPKMPNPMRARLQAEIARTAHAPERKIDSPWFAISWPRFAFGAAFASVLIATGVTWWRAQPASETGTRFAMKEAAAPPETDRAERADGPAGLTLQQAPAEAKESGVLAEAASATSNQETFPLAKAAPASQPASENSPSLASSSEFADSVAQNRDATAANGRQQFSQVAGAKAQSVQKILDNFQVEQNGQELLVVDDDGSTYAGRIEPLAATDTRNLMKEKQAARAARSTTGKGAGASVPNHEYYFRASGYNARLQKSLVFEGNYIVPVPVPAPKDRKVAAKNETEPSAARIVGTAKVPGEPPVQIEAIAVPPK